MQLVNKTQFLNITFFSLLFEAAVVPVYVTIKFPLTSMYVSLKSHKLKLHMKVLNLI